MPTELPTRRLRAWIYNRVSSDPTGRQISVASQNEANHDFCARQGWLVDRVITDNDRSASRWATQDRPGYRDIRDGLTGPSRPDVLVCWESSRGHRDLEEWLPVRRLCETQGVLFAYSGRVFDLARADDRFTTTLDVLLAEREADTIRDRVMRGVRSAASAGRPHGTTPYGYRRVRDARTGLLLEQVPDGETAGVVREITARIIGGDTLHTIAADLTRRGVPTPQARKTTDGQVWEGQGWTSSKIRALYRNPTLAGLRSHREGRTGPANVVPAAWEPVIDPADYWTVRRILADPARAVHHRGVQVKHLCSGIVACGVCGAWLRAQTNRGMPSYLCAGHGPGDPRGKGHVARPREQLDLFVAEAAIARLANPMFTTALARMSSADHVAVDAAERELAELELRLAEATQEARAGRISMTAFGVLEAGLSSDIAAARAVVAGLVVPAPLLVEAAGPGARRIWGEREVAWQRQVVRALMRVVVHRTRRPRGAGGFDVSTVDVTYLA